MNIPIHADFLLVIDLEATCDANYAIPREETEIIEIGAVLVDSTTLTTVDELQTFVRPVQHPVLTKFCIELTSITQAEVDAAPLFPEAIVRLTAWLAGRDALFCSWGAYDKAQFARDAQFHRVELPFGDRHLNLKAQFSISRNTKKQFGMSAALRQVGLELAGTHHRGIDDARNIARLLPWVLR